MKSIKSKHIDYAWTFLLFSALDIAWAIYKDPAWFVLAALFLGMYIFVDIKYLRCPHCGKFINLDRLTYAKKHKYFCNHCGNEIKIV